MADLRTTVHDVLGWLFPRARRAAPTFGVIGAAGLMGTGRAPLWWLGVGLLLALVPVLRSTPAALAAGRRLSAARERLPRWAQHLARDTAVVVALGLLALWIFGEVDAFERLANGDHPVHFAKAWATQQKLVQTGSPYGWTNIYFAGFPLHESYPVGAYLWVVAIWALSFGTLSFSTAYAVAVFAFFVFQGYALYYLGRRTVGVGPALLAAAFLLCDPGGGRAGGFEWAMQWGVWPNSLAAAFGLMGLARTPSLLDRPRPTDIAWTGAFVGLSILTHPVMLLFWAAVALAWLLSLAMDRPVEPGRSILGILASLGLGIGLSATWLARFFTRTKGADDASYGMWWEPAYDVGAELFRLTLIRGLVPALLLLGTLGLGLWLSRWRPGGSTNEPAGRGPTALALVALTIVLAYNSTTIDTLRLPEILPQLEKIQFLRIQTFLRPLWLLAAAYALVWVVRAITKMRTTPTAGRFPLRVLLLSLASPILLGAVIEPFAAARDVSEGRFENVSDWRYDDDLTKAARYLREETSASPFHRVGFDVPGLPHSPADLPYRIGRPTFRLRGSTPATLFPHAPTSWGTAVLGAAQVRYVVTTKLQGDHSRFRLLKRFGAIGVYEVESTAPRPYRRLGGDGKVEVKRFGTDELRFRVTGGGATTIRWPLAWASRWRAYRGNEPVPVERQAVPGTDTPYIATPIPRPGDYRLVFQATALDRAGDATSAATLLLLIGLVAYELRRRSRDSAEDAPRSSSAQPWPKLAWSLLAVAVVVFAASGLAPRRMAKNGTASRFDLVAQARSAEVSLGGHACERLFDRHLCGPEVWAQVAARPSRTSEMALDTCVSAGAPPSGKTLRVRYPNVPAQGIVEGYFAIPFWARGGQWRASPVRFRIRSGGSVLLDQRAGRRGRKHRFSVRLDGRAPEPLTFEVSGGGGDWQPFCFAGAVR